MNETLKRFLDNAEAQKAKAEKDERDAFLISLELIEGTRREYGKHSVKYNSYDKAEKQWYYDRPIPIEVSDDEYEQIKALAPYVKSKSSADDKDYYDYLTDNAENKLSVINALVLILFVVGGIISIIGACQGYKADVTLIVMGITTILFSALIWAFIRVFLVISMNVNHIRKRIK